MLDSLPASLVSPADLAAPLDASQGAKSTRDTPEAIAKAASQFEAVLIGEVLKSAREADGSGWGGTDEDEAGSTLMEVSEQQVSQALAHAGGFGLAKMISAGLSRSSAESAAHTRPVETR